MTTKVETSGSKTKTKDRTVDTRKLFLIVENEDTGFTMDCGADDEPKIRGLAQKIRLAEASSTAAGERRRAATAEAGTALAAAKADRSEVEKAEAARGPDQIARTRRRAKYAWVKWIAAAAVALVVVAAVFGGGGSGDKQPVATTTSSTQAAASASTGHPDHHGTRALRGGARSSRGRQTPP